MKTSGRWRGPLGLAAAVGLAVLLAAAGGPAAALKLLGMPDPNNPSYVVDAEAPVVPWDGSESTSAKVELNYVACLGPFDHADVRETPTTVTITVHLRKPIPSSVSPGCSEANNTELVALHAPLGHRQLLDGYFVPALPPSQAHTVERSRGLPAAPGA